MAGSLRGVPMLGGGREGRGEEGGVRMRDGPGGGGKEEGRMYLLRGMSNAAQPSLSNKKQAREKGREGERGVPVNGNVNGHPVGAELDQMAHELGRLTPDGLADAVEVLEVQLVQGVFDHLRVDGETKGKRDGGKKGGRGGCTGEYKALDECVTASSSPLPSPVPPGLPQSAPPPVYSSSRRHHSIARHCPAGTD